MGLVVLAEQPVLSPSGAHIVQRGDVRGVQFSLGHVPSTALELCLFDGEREHRHPMEQVAEDSWSLYLPGLGAGTRYGYRVPAHPSKLLVDPYARALDAELRWAPSMQPNNDEDSSAVIPKGIVVDPTFDWGDDRRPRVPWRDTLIYECHVKGLTARHPDVPEEIRGTYDALGSEPIIAHLKELGVTSVELLPVFQPLIEEHLVNRGLTNYWGYAPMGFFAPDGRFAASYDGGQVAAFKRMVKALHTAGIEVLLDVVYNHTGEGGPEGPIVSFRGLNESGYYRVNAEKSAYIDVTGCGNTLNFDHPAALQLAVDSLRYWVDEMHVDGFRFDLAVSVGRTQTDEGLRFDPQGGLLKAIARDPVLSEIKLIAEPWDLGVDGYQLAGFRKPWRAWNDSYRDTLRRAWRGDDGQLGALASRVSGSSDVFAGKTPLVSVNYICSHDGFTLHDLTSYENKHNHSNGEDNRDGHDGSFGRNWGVEGESNDPRVLSLRRRAQENLLASLFFSQGVPMLQAGDELGRTQCGNNNAYCHDSPLTWVDWNRADSALLETTRTLSALRRAYPALRQAGFLRGQPAGRDTPYEDLTWLTETASPMEDSHWQDAGRQHLSVLLDSKMAEPGAPRALLVLLNTSIRTVAFDLPRMEQNGRWELVFSTAPRPAKRTAHHPTAVAPFSICLLEYSLNAA